MKKWTVVHTAIYLLEAETEEEAQNTFSLHEPFDSITTVEERP